MISLLERYPMQPPPWGSVPGAPGAGRPRKQDYSPAALARFEKIRLKRIIAAEEGLRCPGVRFLRDSPLQWLRDRAQCGERLQLEVNWRPNERKGGDDWMHCWTCRSADPVRRFEHYVRRARDAGLVYVLRSVEEWIEWMTERGFVCGYQLRHDLVKVGGSGIDRIDNTGAYTHDNMIPACGSCNRDKSTLSVKRFLIKRAELLDPAGYSRQGELFLPA